MVKAGRRRASHQRGAATVLMSCDGILDQRNDFLIAELMLACYNWSLEESQQLGMTFTLSDQVPRRVEFLFTGIVSATVRDWARTSRTRRMGG